jgi:nodulation protein E
MNRVVITGIGIVSPVGCTLNEFWSALVEGRSGIRPIQDIPTARLATAFAAQVLAYDAQVQFGRKQANILDRFAQFAVSAARDAVSDAGLKIDEELAPQVATIIGTGAGGLNTLDDAYYKLYGENALTLHPLTIPRFMGNAAASHVSVDLGLKGPAYSVASACASGTHAIGQAFHMVRSGTSLAQQ